MIAKIMTLLLATLVAHAFGAAAPAPIVVKCNALDQGIQIPDRSDAITKVFNVPEANPCGGPVGNRLTESCESTAKECARITLKSGTPGTPQCDSKYAIGSAAQRISDTCSSAGGYVGSDGNPDLIVYMGKDWVN